MAFINKGLTNQFRMSTRPEPLLPGKHALNPPIVTVIGAGVAGLTAAHELVERGFLVQVVEAAQDPYYPDRPVVGGMAANQRARVRANVEDLHRALIDGVQSADQKKRVLIDWMMWLFSLNRTRWVQTEVPQPIARFVAWLPFTKQAAPAPASVAGGGRVEYIAGREEGGKEIPPLPFRPDKAPDVIEQLVAAKERYRRRWLWDLTIRGALLGAIQGAKAETSALKVATDLYRKWRDAGSSPELMINDLHQFLRDGDTHERDKQWGIKLPTEEVLAEYMSSLVAPAFEREFLCFRIVPRSVQGVDGAEENARKLFESWVNAFTNDPRLRHSLLLTSTGGVIESRAQAQNLQVVPQSEPLLESAMKTPVTAWLQIEVLEQRLPGEHGYRFFPSSYRHLDDTMKRIPITDDAGRMTGRTVFDNLRPTVFQGLGMSEKELATLGVAASSDNEPAARRAPGAKPGARVVEIHRDRARSIEGFRNRTDRFVKRLGGQRRDCLLFFSKMFRFMTSSPERRRAEYEQQTWAKFVEVKKFSAPMQRQIEAAAQALLAFSVGEADARTYGNTATQLMLDQFEDGTRTDRTLNGPTSAAWLEPWRDYLERQGVRFYCRRLVGMDVDKHGEVFPVFADPQCPEPEPLLTYEAAGERNERAPDFYVLALSLGEAARALFSIKERVAEFPKEFDKVIELYLNAKESKAQDEEEGATRGLKDMTGVQLFFDAKTSIGRGHMYFPLSEWGLSSISQSEFWLTRGGFSDGYMGVLSVDVCTTGEKDRPGKGTPTFWDKLLRDPSLEGAVEDKEGALAADGEDAAARGRFAVAHQIWQDIAERIDGQDRLAEPRSFHLDTTISRKGNASKFLASTPLLRDRPGRPGGDKVVGPEEIAYGLHFKRWVACGTYMATHTRMTTMEAANESARHAVKPILDRLGQPIVRHHESLFIDGELLRVDALGGRDHNGAWEERPFDPPDVWNPEDHELEDVDIFRRIDRRLVELGLPHFLDILDFDRKLALALDEAEIYGVDPEKKIAKLMGLASSVVDATATKERGPGYAAEDAAHAAKLKSVVEKLAKSVDPARFPDLKTTLDVEDLTLADLIKHFAR